MFKTALHKPLFNVLEIQNANGALRDPSSFLYPSPQIWALKEFQRGIGQSPAFSTAIRKTGWTINNILFTHAEVGEPIG